MHFDPAIAVSEVDSFGVMLNHYLRHVELSGDKKTCEVMMAKLGYYAEQASRTRVNIIRGRRWQLVCKTCNYKLPPNTHGKMICVNCDTRLTYWNLDRAKQ